MLNESVFIQLLAGWLVEMKNRRQDVTRDICLAHMDAKCRRACQDDIKAAQSICFVSDPLTITKCGIIERQKRPIGVGSSSLGR